MNESTQQQKRTFVLFRYKLWLMLIVVSAILIVGYFSISYGLAVRAHRSAEIEFTARNYNRAVVLAKQAVGFYPFPRWTAQSAYELLIRSLIEYSYHTTMGKQQSLASAESAQSIARRAQALYPQNALFWTLEASAIRIPTIFGYYIEYNYEAVASILQHAERLNPRFPELQLEKAAMYFFRIKRTIAENQSARELLLTHENQALFDVWFKSIEENLQNALQQDLNFAPAHWLLGMLWWDLYNPNRALSHAETYVVLNSKSPYGHLLKGSSLFLLGRQSDSTDDRRDFLSRAINSLNTAIQLEPQFPLAWAAFTSLAASQNLLGEYAAARDSANHAIRIVTGQWKDNEIPAALYRHLGDAYAGLYFEYRLQKYYNEALLAYQTALSLDPEYSAVQIALDNLQTQR